MAPEKPVTMTPARFAALVEAYGGDSLRWPQVEREAAQHWLAANPEAMALVALARSLDELMVQPEPADVSATLQERLLADFDRAASIWTWRKVARAAAEAMWPGAPLWQPACALGLAVAVGFGVAVFVPLDIAPPNDNASAVFALDRAPDADAGQGI